MALAFGVSLPLEHPHGWTRPPRWPRGDLLVEHDDRRIYAYNPKKILSWLEWARTMDDRTTQD